MKRLFNRGKWLWLESTNPLIMSYMNEKNPSNLIVSEITSIWFFLLHNKKYLFFQFNLENKGLYVSMKIFFPLFKSYRKKNFPISLCKQLLMLVNHKNLKIKCLCSSSNCLPWKIKLTLVSIKSMQLNTENFYTQKENMNANFFNF